MGKRGRPVGSKSKSGLGVRDNILAVYTRLGGSAQMAKWAKKNQSAFYQIYARLAPQEVTTPPGQPLEMAHVPTAPMLLQDYYAKVAESAAAADSDPGAARPVGQPGRAWEEPGDDPGSKPR